MSPPTSPVHADQPGCNGALGADTVRVDTEAAARAFHPSPPSAEAWLARFERRGEIARGGMGSIEIVYDRRLRRELALKVVLARDPGPRELARFVLEAQVTGQLAHPGIPPVHDLGVTQRGRRRCR